jgi:hypothetical protein
VATDRESLKIPPVPGVKTLVRPDSEKDLPTTLDREKERALPPDAANPRSPSDSGSGAGGGRVLPEYEYNTPDNGIPERMRTLPTPGEEYGHPTKYDYNYVTRRPDVIASEEDDEEMSKEAYKRRWRPGQRQKKQRGPAKRKRQMRYRKNRAKERMRARRSYKRNRKNPQFKRLQKHRRKHPSQHRRRRASAENVATMFLESWEVGPKFPEKRQRRQTGIPRSRSQQIYRQEKSKRQRDALKRYHDFCKRDRRCMEKRKLYRENPGRFRRRGSVLTTPQISFGIGPDLLPGTVHSLSPMTAIVTFVIDYKDVDPLQSMSVIAFLRSVVFLSEDDIDAMFDLIDVEIGEEAYQDIDESALRECAYQYDIDVDSMEFADRCMNLVGEEDLSAMTPDQLDEVNDKLVLGVLEGGGWPRETEGDEDDIGPDDEYDWHLYYGEVPNPDRGWTEEELRAAGTIIQYDQEGPKLEIDYPGKDVDYTPTAPNQWTPKPDEEEGLPPGNKEPNQHLDDADPASGKVVPPGEGQFYYVDLSYLAERVAARHLKTAATIDEIASRTGPDVHGRARGLRARLRRADPKRGIWTFEVRGSSGTYRIRVKGIRKGNIKNLEKAQVQVSCSCPFWRWQGPEYWAKSNSYLYGRPRGTATKPDIKDPRGQHWACKHVLAALNLARRYRFGSSGLGIIAGAEIVPVSEATMTNRKPRAERVAARFLHGRAALEITTARPGEGQRAWPRVTYHGDDIFDAYLKAISAAERRLERDDPDGEGQEAYLGYSSKRDQFLSAFDWWPGDMDETGREMMTGFVLLEMRNGNMRVVGSDFIELPLYGSGGAYKDLERQYKIDQPLRYD